MLQEAARGLAPVAVRAGDLRNAFLDGDFGLFDFTQPDVQRQRQPVHIVRQGGEAQGDAADIQLFKGFQQGYLAREISLLESLEKLDVSGITLRLATLADNVDRLPLALDIRLREIEEAKIPVKEGVAQVASADGNWRQTARSLWQDILSLVRIRDDVASQRPLLPPEQQYFLRENLRLMLYGAQQALLQGSVPTYQQNLKTPQRLLKDYFDVESQVVTAMQTELARLQTMKILTDMPDITASLTTLRRLVGRSEAP